MGLNNGLVKKTRAEKAFLDGKVESSDVAFPGETAHPAVPPASCRAQEGRGSWVCFQRSVLCALGKRALGLRFLPLKTWVLLSEPVVWFLLELLGPGEWTSSGQAASPLRRLVWSFLIPAGFCMSPSGSTF